MEQTKQQNNITTPEVISYEKSKIELLFKIPNNLQFTGIQQAQAIAQISVILGQPIQTETDKDGKNDEVK